MLTTNVDKMAPGANFTNILRPAFTRTDSKNAKNNDNLTVFFALLGSARFKASCKMLIKLTPDDGQTEVVWVFTESFCDFQVKILRLKCTIWQNCEIANSFKFVILLWSVLQTFQGNTPWRARPFYHQFYHIKYCKT